MKRLCSTIVLFMSINIIGIKFINATTTTATSIHTLSSQSGQQLLAHVRAALEKSFGNPTSFTHSSQQIAQNPELAHPAGVFVTLRSANGKLRGCRGFTQSRKPLHKAVVEAAHLAAFNDHRFEPLTKAELPTTRIEISVLTPPKPIAHHNEIDINKHGIILHKGAHRALFLPHVAREHGWTKEKTLTQLSKKAGLTPQAWRRGSSFEVFEEIHFKE